MGGDVEIDRRTRRRNPDGFITDWRSTLLYLAMATVLAAVIIAAIHEYRVATEEALVRIVIESCDRAIGGARKVESDQRIERMLEQLLEHCGNRCEDQP